MSSQYIYDKAMALLLKGADEYLKKFDKKTGRFLEANGGWAVTNQDNILSLAYLYTKEDKNNRFHMDHEILEVIKKAGDAIRNFQYPDGQVEFIKVDGSKWGAIYMPWTMYHWLEAYIIIKGFLEEERQKYWEEGLILAFNGIEKELKTAHVHNIPVWNAMSLNRAGNFFNKKDWIKTADNMMKCAVGEQDSSGYWPEHGGPTTLYNSVYVHALGLYHLHGGKTNVLPSIEKALKFHEAFTYPDGTYVETIDGRVKYKDSILAYGMVSYSLIPEGKGYVRFLLEQASKKEQAMFNPHFAAFLIFYTDWENEKETLNTKRNYNIESCNAMIFKENNWFICMSGFTAPKTDERWGMDRQSFLSIWHNSAGLLIGAGNSKQQPEWSTFRTKTQYVPDNGGVDIEKRKLSLTYEDTVFSLQLEEISQNRLVFGYKTINDNDKEAWMNIPIRFKKNGKTVIGDRTFNLCQEIKIHDDGSYLIYENFKIIWTGCYRLEWPSYPFNPYAKDGSSDINEAVGILSLQANTKESKVIIEEI